MTAELRRSIVLAAAGLLGGFAMVVALFGTGELLKRNAAVNPSAETPAAPDKPNGTETGDRAGEAPSTGSPHAALPALPQGESGAAGRAGPEPDGAPSFDIVRVEPDGASVIAGRTVPNARIELMRDGRPFAAATADASGQFALTPPDLPTGSSEISLRATAADGRTLAGRESVTVVVAETRNTKPLIALSAPDRPTQVLSQPDAPEAQGATTKPPTAVAESPGTAAPATAGTAEGGRVSGGTTGTARIVSVDAQEGGRLDVTGQAAAGSAVRLYLNDTLVASGQAGADGRVAFTIGRGVKPGAYRIRVDTGDPAGGKVRSRAEVAFVYPDSPPTRFAGAGPEERSAPSQKRDAAAMPAERPATHPAQGTPGKTPAAQPMAPSLAAAPLRTGKQAGTEPASPAPSGTPSIAATAVPTVPSPERDGRAAAALAPALPGKASGAPASAGRERLATAEPGGASPSAAEAGSVFVPEISTARITRGDSLWQISRRTYGHGHRYTVIYDANQQQIRNPDLIYPGQMFVLPKDESSSGTPAAKPGTDRRT
ncbi:LysM peptidoglycan-binding domain-containing protein [Methylobacterium sp. B4]|uniref:LysM peptidoglycan-binding domain-containing protein n=1 Tax=Methylobacterium sp. B4 TaxID=1938755 RepID=UPI000D766CCB|nr:LysM peptidoglycan-binding domain-containing protein [Methylobacterium sp. B4]PXW56200.1 LysM domain-containing protein [Methylobacterium sp. B4]